MFVGLGFFFNFLVVGVGRNFGLLIYTCVLRGLDFWLWMWFKAWVVMEVGWCGHWWSY